MRRLRNEDGATLIIALFFATAIAIVIAALAGLTFTSQQAGTAYATRGKLVNALDAAIQAGVENARLQQACAPDIDLAGPNAINGNGVRVHCDPTATPTLVTLTATAICPPPPAAQPATTIVATARLSTIGSGDHPPRLARVESWKIVTGGCT
jgi:uncharacterized protein YqfA (UPF0365 family)